MVKYKKYVIWVFALSYLYAAFFYLMGVRAGTTPYLVMNIGYMWIPGLIAVAFWIREKRPLKTWGILVKPNKWFVFAWLIFPVLIFINIPVSTLWPGASFSLYMTDFIAQYENMLPPDELEAMREQLQQNPLLPMGLIVVQGLIAALTINLAAALGEELGWRGYLYERLIHGGFWKCSLITGIIWGFWHAPLILQGHNYPAFPVAGVFLMVILTILLSPLFTLIRMRTLSAVAAGIAHGALNAFAGISVMYVAGGHILWNGFHQFSGFLLLSVVNLLIYLASKSKPELLSAKIHENGSFH